MSENRTTIPKPTVEPGKLVEWKMIVECLGVSDTRLSARPDDKELIDDQIDSRTESAIYAGKQMDKVFTSMLGGLVKGQKKVYEVEYEEYEPANLVAIERKILLASGVKPASLRKGVTLGRDVLRGKTQIDGQRAELEIIEMKTVQDKDLIVLDSNEPLRGLKVRYRIEILDVREPTEQEIANDSA